jgi:hypothetical protein
MILPLPKAKGLPSAVFALSLNMSLINAPKMDTRLVHFGEMLKTGQAKLQAMASK